MSRNKRLGALLLAALLLAARGALADANADLIAPEDIQADEVNYKTSVAARGEFIKTVQTGASEYYPLVTPVIYRGDTAVYSAWMVKRGAEVKAGDPLMAISVPFDEVKETRLALELERAQTAFEEGKASRQAEMDALRTALSAETDEFARKTLRLKLERARVAMEQYVYQQEYDLKSREETLEKLRARHAADYIVAPCDGVVEEIVYMHEGDRVYDGRTVCRIARQDVMLLAAKDSDLRYGMEVTIETGANKARHTITGHVVAASDCLPKVSSSYALIEPDPFEPTDDFSWKNIRVVGEKVALRNVLVIARKAAVLDGGKYRVTKLSEDGITQKRNIIQGLTTTDLTWVLQGLEEGEAVIID